MFRIDSPGATPDHKFSRGDVAKDIPPTTITPKWLNAVQEELRSPLGGALTRLDGSDNTQLAQAIDRFAGYPGPQLKCIHKFLFKEGIPDEPVPLFPSPYKIDGYFNYWMASTFSQGNVDHQVVTAYYDRVSNRWSISYSGGEGAPEWSVQSRNNDGRGGIIYYKKNRSPASLLICHGSRTFSDV